MSRSEQAKLAVKNPKFKDKEKEEKDYSPLNAFRGPLTRRIRQIKLKDLGNTPHAVLNHALFPVAFTLYYFIYIFYFFLLHRCCSHLKENSRRTNLE